ncbi:MAG: hypothetical protein RIE06_27485 [Roseibium album]|uniref:hypothetical protein n=1 Tax=Roseibium album TaxID=311410 RepID=UPI0032EB38FF
MVDGLSKAGLGDEDFASAKRDVDRLEDLEAAIREYDENVAANVDRVRRLEEEIGDRERPDVKVERAKVAESAEGLEKDRSECTRLQTELNRKNDVLMDVNKISVEIASLEERYRPLDEISNLVNGNNERKVRLPDFAIAAMFDKVLAAANLRLGPMSNGRYQLHRPAESTGCMKKRGLDIAVHDANTERS